MCIFSKPLSVGNIYCISRDGMSECYIGSTFNFNSRFDSHSSCCNNKKYNYKVYKFIRENGGFQKWTMKIIKKVLVSSKRQLVRYEDEYIVRLKPALNSHRARRSSEEYYKDNRREKIDNMIKYYDDNKDEINKRTDCCCGGKYTHIHRARHLRTPRHKRYVNEGIIFVPKCKK